ncbi:MAG: hypothetical protein AAGA30_04985, partial [Planctomycetota bacterium]
MSLGKTESEKVVNTANGLGPREETTLDSTTKKTNLFVRLLLFGLPILVGLGGLAFAINRQTPIKLKPESERSQKVRVLRIQPIDFTPSATGNGLSKPERVWDAVAEISGKVSNVHPSLRSGGLVSSDDVLLTIDDQ